jgi:glycosyltransferase involved in cell wall biosynthesis
MEKVKVSVCITVYNLEPFLAQSIESVLAQKTNFSIEIVIIDDCSKDGSRSIIKTYANTYPNIVKPFFNETNLKYSRNYLKALSLAEGKYIAILDGDDLWTDPYKLQKQIDFLESHEDFVMSHHNGYLLYSDGSKREFNRKSKLDEYSTLQLLEDSNNWNSSVVYRNIFKGNYPEWLKNAIHPDYPLHVLHSLHGKIHYIQEPLGFYRIHDTNISNQINEDKNKTIEFILNSAYVAKMLEISTKNTLYKGKLKLMQGRLYNHISGLYLYRNNYYNFVVYLLKSFFVCPIRSWFEYKEAFNITFKVAKS